MSTTKAVTESYIECALWSSLDENDEPLDGLYTSDDLSAEAKQEIKAEISDFLGLLEREGVDVSTLDPAQIGHDFWLTRNRHGTGFWDRGLGDLGETLTRWAHSFGESYLYVGDDGKIYVP